MLASVANKNQPVQVIIHHHDSLPFRCCVYC